MPVINELLKMRRYFETGNTKSYSFRKEQLIKLKTMVEKYQQAIQDALYKDLKKSAEEAWITETGFVASEINYILNNLKDWMQEETVSTNFLNIPSKSYIVTDPLGIILIIGPWNYPLQLLFTPLAGAIAAGNCVVLKASEFAPATAAIMKIMIAETFDEQYVLFKDGDGASVIPEMMENFVFDHVFYTGSSTVGKLIYQMAAKNLVPVTLELGGKSPCVVLEDADIKVAARRIAMGKFSNAGQICVTPDYVLVHESKKEQLVAELRKALLQFFGKNAIESYDYGRIINEKQFDRLATYFTQGNILTGGKMEREQLYIEPTLMDGVSMDAPIMKEEIFGPILPIISFTTMEQAQSVIAQNRNPLAFYLFTSDTKKEKVWMNAVLFGGGCINNVLFHLTNHELPFGGRGFSGTGSYHGKFSFDTFSHKKGILKTPTWFDPKAKYPSYKGKMKILKWLMK